MHIQRHVTALLTDASKLLAKAAAGAHGPDLGLMATATTTLRSAAAAADPAGVLSANGRIVLSDVIGRTLDARSLLHGGDVGAATSALSTARFGLELLLPG